MSDRMSATTSAFDFGFAPRCHAREQKLHLSRKRVNTTADDKPERERESLWNRNNNKLVPEAGIEPATKGL